MPREVQASNQKVNVLLVDDQPANLLALQAILEDLGANLVQARSGEEALSLSPADEFAVILLDVQMHGLDGFQTARLIREREQRHTPIIFVTAHETDRTTLEQAYALGAVDFLVKPLVPIILRTKVAGFIELFQKTEQVRRQAQLLLDSERQGFQRAVMDNMAEGLYTVDTRGLLTYMNPAAERLFGWTSAELLGRNMHEMTHYRRPDGTHFPIEECAGFGVLHHGTGLRDHNDAFIRKDGSFFPVTYSSSPLRSDEQVMGLVVVFRDMTERHKAEADRLRLAAIVESSDDAIVSKDLNGS